MNSNQTQMQDIKEHFQQFRGMTPYLKINEQQWEYIKNTYPKEDIIETLSEVCHTYPLPIPVYTDDEILDDYKKLKGIWWADILVEGEWYPRNGQESRYPITFDGKYLYFKKPNRLFIIIIFSPISGQSKFLTIKRDKKTMNRFVQCWT